MISPVAGLSTAIDAPGVDVNPAAVDVAGLSKEIRVLELVGHGDGQRDGHSGHPRQGRGLKKEARHQWQWLRRSSRLMALGSAMAASPVQEWQRFRASLTLVGAMNRIPGVGSAVGVIAGAADAGRAGDCRSGCGSDRLRTSSSSRARRSRRASRCRGTTRRTAATFAAAVVEQLPPARASSPWCAPTSAPATRRRGCTGSSTTFPRPRQGLPAGCRSIRRRRCPARSPARCRG